MARAYAFTSGSLDVPASSRSRLSTADLLYDFSLGALTVIDHQQPGV